MPSTNAQIIERVLNIIQLPLSFDKELSWYEVDTQKLFPTRSGNLIAYLIRKPKTKFEPWLRYGVKFDEEFLNKYTEELSRAKWVEVIIRKAIHDFLEHLEAYPNVENKNKYFLDANGGSLGTGDNNADT